MARISFVHPDDIKDLEMRAWMDDAITRRRTAQGTQRSLTMLGVTMRAEGLLDQDLRELMRARMSTSWGRMFATDCHY